MAYHLPLDKMSIEEKILTMESIWEDLCKTAASIDSPEWHKQVLNEREAAHERGDDEFIDWDTAKKDIRNKTQ